MGWYNTDKLDKHAPNYPVNIVMGARRIGKTLHFQMKALKHYMKTGQSTLWLRNFESEFKDNSMVNEFLNGPRRVMDVPEEFEGRADGIYADEKDSDCIVKFASINRYSKLRGNEYAWIDYIVHDEFMPEDRKYPRQPFKGINSITQTVFAGREDTQLYMLSNYISAGNPYMAGWRVIPSVMDVTPYADKGVALEVCRGYASAIDPKGKWSKVYRAANYQSYSDQNEDGMITLLTPIPHGARKFKPTVYIRGIKHGSWYHEGKVYWGVDKSVDDCWTYVADREDITSEIGLFPGMFVKDLRKQFDKNVLRYADVNVMFDVMSIIFKDM